MRLPSPPAPGDVELAPLSGWARCFLCSLRPRGPAAALWLRASANCSRTSEHEARFCDGGTVVVRAG